ncbi:MAG: hypothetical protein K6E51_10420 [Treponema sp.]|nr:hypothetical protein [Treponema sp.]
MWKWLLFAASYSLCFALSRWLYVYLICDSAGEIVAAFMWPYEKIIPYFIGLLGSEKALHPFFIVFTIILVLLQYFLFIAENLLVKKLFAFTFRKSDYVLLFAYPIFVIFFSSIFLSSGGANIQRLALLVIQLFLPAHSSLLQGGGDFRLHDD